jgi:hypothetical protein
MPDPVALILVAKGRRLLNYYRIIPGTALNINPIPKLKQIA